LLAQLLVDAGDKVLRDLRVLLLEEGLGFLLQAEAMKGLRLRTPS
jgi:hypothetical protein